MSPPAANELVGEVSRPSLPERDHSERRRSRRALLTCPVYVKCDSFEQPLLSKTRDISGEGFYCQLNQAVRPGEIIECDIVLTIHRFLGSNDVIYLRCRARAVRVEEIDAGLEFGVACRIEEYRVVRREGSSI